MSVSNGGSHSVGSIWVICIFHRIAPGGRAVYGGGAVAGAACGTTVEPYSLVHDGCVKLFHKWIYPVDNEMNVYINSHPADTMLFVALN